MSVKATNSTNWIAVIVLSLIGGGLLLVQLPLFFVFFIGSLYTKSITHPFPYLAILMNIPAYFSPGMLGTAALIQAWMLLDDKPNSRYLFYTRNILLAVSTIGVAGFLFLFIRAF